MGMQFVPRRYLRRVTPYTKRASRGQVMPTLSKSKRQRTFHKALSAPLRWLECNTGRRWAEVRTKVEDLFETHALGGRLIVLDRDRSWVVSEREINHRFAHFVVDDDGVLQRGLRFPSKLFKFQMLPEGKRHVSHKRIERWAAGRKVGRRGRHLFWFVPVRNGKANTISGYRQDVELTERETEFWNMLLEEAQSRFVFDKVGI